jgi:glycosyltransferase involved in cell wall biosynthesis
VDGLTQALATLIHDEPLRRNMAMAGRQRARRRFDLEAMTSAIEQVYRETLTR